MRKRTKWTDEEKRYTFDFINEADDKPVAMKLLAEEFGSTYGAIYQQHHKMDVKPDVVSLASTVSELESKVLDSLSEVFRQMKLLESRNAQLSKKLEEAESDRDELARIFQLARKFAKEEQPSLKVTVNKNMIVESVKEEYANDTAS